MAAAESLEKSRAETARRPEPALSTEQTSLQSLSPQRKSGTTVELPVRGSNGQLSAEVDGSTAVAATALVSEARRHADRSYRRNADQPGTRLQEYALSTPESETHGRHKHRIRRVSANQTGRVNCNFLQIPAQSHKTKDLGKDELRLEWDARLSPDERAALKRVIDGGGTTGGGGGISSKAAMDYAIAHSFERASAIPEKRLKAEALRYGVGSVLPHDIDEASQDRPIIRRAVKGETQVTTKDVLMEEVRMLKFA